MVLITYQTIFFLPYHQRDLMLSLPVSARVLWLILLCVYFSTTSVLFKLNMIAQLFYVQKMLLV